MKLNLDSISLDSLDLWGEFYRNILKYNSRYLVNKINVLEVSMPNILLLVFIAIFISACSSMASLEELDNLYYKNSSFDKSYSYVESKSNNDFLWNFQKGILALQNLDYKKSIAYLDSSEKFFENYSAKGVGNEILEGIATVLAGNGIFDYHGNLYEAVFVNYYKALNYFMIGDYAASRIEFNRANDRQRRAKDFFAKKINEYSSALNDSEAKYKDEAKGTNKQKTYNAANDILESKYKNLKRFKAYDGYVNPFITYISGIFFLMQNDFNKSFDLLKEAYAVSGIKEISSDISILEKRKASKDSKHYTWLIIEDGKSPKKGELRLELPLFLPDQIVYFGVAFPTFIEGSRTYNNYQIKDDNNRIYNAFEVSNLNPLLANEFEMAIPYIITTSILSSSYKAYLQYFLGNALGAFGSIGGAIFSLASTNADTRVVRILPFRQLVIRIENHASSFNLIANNRILYNFRLSSDCSFLCIDRDNIIYARILNKNISIITQESRRNE